jgi:hypothetical protein
VALQTDMAIESQPFSLWNNEKLLVFQYLDRQRRARSSK